MKEQPGPGQVKITFNTPPYPHRHLLASHTSTSWLVLLSWAVIGSAILFVFCGLFLDNSVSPVPIATQVNTPISTIIQPPRPRLILPKKPHLSGKFASFIEREHGKSAEALVLTYENLKFKTVQSYLEIPQKDRQSAVVLQPITSVYRQNTASTFQVFDALQMPYSQPNSLSIQQEWIKTNSFDQMTFSSIQRRLELLRASARPPYILHGDVSIEYGPLLNNDRLIADLLTSNRDLKQASITLIDGSPRGPPSDTLTENRAVRTIYIIGKVVKFKGPSQHATSVLQASVIDQYSEIQLQKYLASTKIWEQRTKEILGQYYVPDEKLWSVEAEKGLVIENPVTKEEYTRNNIEALIQTEMLIRHNKIGYDSSTHGFSQGINDPVDPYHNRSVEAAPHPIEVHPI